MGKKSEKYVIQRLKKAEKRVKALDELVDALEAENAELNERLFESPIARAMRREYLRSCLLADGTEQHDDALRHAGIQEGYRAFDVWVDEAICEWRRPDDMTGEQFKEAFRREFIGDLMEEYGERKRRFEERAAEEGE